MTIQYFRSEIEQHDTKYPMDSFHTEGKNSNNTQGQKRKRGDGQSGGGDAGGISATDCAKLEAHGYVVEPRDIEGESRYAVRALSRVRQPFYLCAALTLDLKIPSNICIVYRRSDLSKKFVAKKVHKRSNELNIFKIINTSWLKSDHVVSLHQLVQTQSTSWVILPKMNTVDGYILQPHKPYGKVAQISLGLIKGVAFLHELCITHRDIKPANLLVDWNSCLQIIDFDIAVRVNDEDEVVDGEWGMKGWMAPEIGKSMYSPIKADRWSSGKSSFPFSEQFQGRGHGSERHSDEDCEEADGT